MSGPWQSQLLGSKITCLAQDDRLKAHYQIDANTEMAEEYDARTGLLLLRCVFFFVKPMFTMQSKCLQVNLIIACHPTINKNQKSLPKGRPCARLLTSLSALSRYSIQRNSMMKFHKIFKIYLLCNFILNLEEIILLLILLLFRKWRRKSALGGAPKTWDYEIGEDALKSYSTNEVTGAALDLFENSSNPVCVARSTKGSYLDRFLAASRYAKTA